MSNSESPNQTRYLINYVVFDIETRNIFQDVGRADPALLDISVVGLYDLKTDTYKAFVQEDFKEMWPYFENADMIIGYNSDHFDIPLLNKYYPGDITEIKSLDILKEIKDSIGRRVRLDQVAEGTLGKRKSGHGLEAVEWWKKGEIEKIKKYCLMDVKITKEVFEFALANKKLLFKEGGKKNEIPLNVNNWLTIEAQSMTHTLGF